MPYYVSVAALTSKGRGEFKTKVAIFSMQGSKLRKVSTNGVQYFHLVVPDSSVLV